ncbi:MULTISPECIES: MBL fold metallo-hydrolase [Methylomonas]|uniref:MBL fold metallo-hydrolase n=2 Tax=Methylomonas TaxID=416 RepID=A0A140E767_9GAMM|nr:MULTISPECIES: MBL fold metallo-hydrolase [Methylomonas]AMK79241.1 MBL fold metallo-hydrolase [Methylomonas denitrificans]OAH98130.1 MBL fold metallo-hydrolase [Methylomonas methanica]TCV86240.1 glyoxylase-like metal-dependent hydrolase (beta-lactamase superfamily II) [Methylomonas methanica]
MRRSIPNTLALAIALAAAGCSSLHQNGLQIASDAAGAANIKSIEFTGTGRWYQFGQAPNPDLPWPPFDVKGYTADINYDTASARVQIARLQVVEPGRNRPAPVEQKADQYVSGNNAWNVATAGNAAVTAQPAAVEERAAEIWATPHGFFKAALANHAESKNIANGSEVSFSVGGKYRYVGTINAKHQLETVKTWIDNPVLGDTLVETRYSDYKAFDGGQFPSHIVRTQGGFPVLDLNVTAVKANPAVDIAAPAEALKPAAVAVAVNKLADGVYYLTGGTHHSVAIEQLNHIVLVEAPLNEERSQALIAKLQEIIPNKPIKYLVNTHAHFDHSGGLRTFVDAGATIVTHQPNQAYYEKVWANPHSINPDRLEKSKKTASFTSFAGKQVLSDGKRNIEIHSLTGNSHNDAFVAVYLPKEKILIEADAYTPPAANATAPTSVNPYSLNLYENIQKLKLDVGQIAALHGPRVVTLADLRSAIGITKASR